MMCTSLPSFSGATLWMLLGDTTSESPSASEVAVFNARPCACRRAGISAAGHPLPWARRTQTPALQASPHPTQPHHARKNSGCLCPAPRPVFL